MTASKTRPGGIIDNRFLLKSMLGGGGAANVWRATDLTTREDVAIKLLHSRFRGNAEAEERLAREASLLASFTHPNIARARSFELDHAQPYFVMTLISGQSLEDEMAARSGLDDYFPWSELLRIVGQMADAVDYAHERGVIHRDLKPSNVMLDGEVSPPEVRILDFGIAKLLGGASRNPTTKGRVMGTDFYMAPEQAVGGAIDRRADLFALGVIVFEMVTLRRAWVRTDRGGPVRAFAEPARRNEFNTPNAILRRMGHETRPRASDFRAGLSSRVDAALAWALAIEPDDRPPSASAFCEELASATHDAEDSLGPERSEWADEDHSLDGPTAVPTAHPTIAVTEPTPLEEEGERPTVRPSGALPPWRAIGPVVPNPTPSPLRGIVVPPSLAPTRIEIDRPTRPESVDRPAERIDPPVGASEPAALQGASAPTGRTVGTATGTAAQAGLLSGVPPMVRFAVISVGVLAATALLLLVGYLLGRQTVGRRSDVLCEPPPPAIVAVTQSHHRNVS